jgi:hypothetical protein
MRSLLISVAIFMLHPIPLEIVIGYVDATQEQVKRIFISRAQVPDWKYRRICPPIVVLPANYPDTFAYYQSDYYPIKAPSVCRK